MQIRRFSNPVSKDALLDYLCNPRSVMTDSEALESDIDLQEFSDSVDNLLSTTPNDAGNVQRAKWDQELVEPLHRAMKPLPLRDLADMRLWHWMCVGAFPQLVWRRWQGEIPNLDEFSMPKALAERFVGTNSLHGISRNALARLFWCGASLFTTEDQYSLAKSVIERQDLFQNIFERGFSLYQPAARACVRELRDSGEKQWRIAAVNLDHQLTTTTLEALDEEYIRSMLMSGTEG